MGKGLFEQESGAGTQLQAQVINSRVNSPHNTVTVGMSSLKRYPVVLPGKLAKFTIDNGSFLPASSPCSLSTGSFPDTQPPVSLSQETHAFPENDNFFLCSHVQVDSSVIDEYMNRLNMIKTAKAHFKQCPVGKQGGGSSNTTNSGSSPTSCYSMWGGNGSQISGIGGSGNGMGGAGGGDDDPNKNNPYDIGSIPADKLFEMEDNGQFNPFDYLDPSMEAALFREIAEIPLDDLVMPYNHNASNFNHIRDHTQSYPTDPSDRSTTDPPSTPAPLTPGGHSFPITPMGAPMTPMAASVTTPTLASSMTTPNNSSLLVGSPSCTSVEQSDHSDNTQDLLEIQKLMINSGAGSSKPPFISDTTSSLITTPMGHPSATTLIPHQSTSYHLASQDTHVPTMRPIKSSTIIATPQQHPQLTTQDNDIDFLAANLHTNDYFHCIELYVPFNLPYDKKDTGYRAFQHNYSVYLQLQEALRDSSLSELQVANREVAKLCTMELPHAQSPKICFKMPKTCVPLSTWVNENHSVLRRQLVIQQMVNTLTILFKAQNELCFWGSSQIWVDTDYRVYLYIDFIKALGTQKEYARKMLTINPRVEDCKVLMELYNTVLKPYLQRNTTWISPELTSVFKTFEDLLKIPENCVSNMAYVARILSSRRICQLRVQLMIGATFEYDIYCAEHEKVSTAMELVAPMLPSAISRQWAVVRCHDNNPVGILDIAVKKAEASYMLIPLPEGYQKLPGALYIESNQSFPWS